MDGVPPVARIRVGDGNLVDGLNLVDSQQAPADIVQTETGVGQLDCLKQHFPLCQVVISNPLPILQVARQGFRPQQKLLHHPVFRVGQLLHPPDFLQRLVVLSLGVQRLDLLVQVGDFHLSRPQQKRKGIFVHPQPLQQQGNCSHRWHMAAPLDAGQGGLAAKAAAQIFLIDVLFFSQLPDAVPDVVSLHLSALPFYLLLPRLYHTCRFLTTLFFWSNTNGRPALNRAGLPFVTDFLSGDHSCRSSTAGPSRSGCRG